MARPITFDNDLYFTYNVTENSSVSVIYDKEPNRFLTALYGKDSVFTFQQMSYQQINYTALRESDVVVLSEVPSVSSGLGDELSKFVKGSKKYIWALFGKEDGKKKGDVRW